MVTKAGAGGASPEEEGRTAEQLHLPIPYDLTERGRRAVGGRVDAIAERVDGAYIPDTGDRDARAIHGWYYPDSDALLP